MGILWIEEMVILTSSVRNGRGIGVEIVFKGWMGVICSPGEFGPVTGITYLLVSMYFL